MVISFFRCQKNCSGSTRVSDLKPSLLWVAVHVCAHLHRDNVMYNFYSEIKTAATNTFTSWMPHRKYVRTLWSRLGLPGILFSTFTENREIS